MILVAASATLLCVGVILMVNAMKRPEPSRDGFEPENATVQAALFSGLPNPQWTLRFTEREECLKRLGALPRMTRPEPERGLGYSGLRLQLTQPNGDIVGFRIHDGGVWKEDDVAIAYADEGQAFERWLITTAPPDIRRLLSTEL
jgi:hypothetical protein